MACYGSPQHVYKSSQTREKAEGSDLRSRRARRPGAESLVTTALLAVLLSGCGRGRLKLHGAPAPSASAITLGVEMGACSDVAVCERECDGGSADRCRRLAASYAFG